MIYLFFKRVLDIIASCCAIILLLPLFFVIAVLIKIDSKGPVFFKQIRIGKNGKRFKMIKFRSMVVNAQDIGTGLFNYRDDPRVTKVGRFLRNTSIDEFPQIYNIFIGNMSFIGPRPPVENELGDFDTLNRKYKERFQVKPGMSGLAQVTGRNELPWDEKVVYDNTYVDLVKSYKGFFIDIRIFVKTLLKVFSKSDIYESEVEGSTDAIESAKIAKEEIIKLAHKTDEE